MFYRSRKTLPIYDSIWLDVVVSDDIKKLNKEFECDSPGWFACVFKRSFKQKKLWRKSIVVVLNPNHPHGSKITHATIVHECIHIKNFIFGQIGHKCKSANDEPEAYLTEFLFNIVSTFYDDAIAKEKKLNSKKKKNGKR